MKITIKKEVEVEVEITKEDLKDYEQVRERGLTNMFDMKKVETLSDNLTIEKIIAIQENYPKLMKMNW